MAGQVNEVDSEYRDGRYRFRVVAAMAAPADRVRAVLHDFDGLHRLHDSILQSRPVEGQAGVERVHLLTRPCVWFFCLDVVQVMDFWDDGEATLRARVLPEQSDFRGGQLSWEVRETGPNQCRLEFKSDLEPSFWVPPLIGPLVVRHKLTTVAVEMTESVSRLAADSKP